jgi:hypothetical protein
MRPATWTGMGTGSARGLGRQAVGLRQRCSKSMDTDALVTSLSAATLADFEGVARVGGVEFINGGLRTVATAVGRPPMR